MKLRPRQDVCVGQIRQAYRDGYRAPLFVAPTGFGKTIVFAYITLGAMQRGNPVMILAHRVELIDQISKALAEFNVPHSFIAAGYEFRKHLPVYVCSVFTVAKRLDWFSPALVVVDEAHHCIPTSTWGAVFAAYPAAHRLGVTATPCRFSGEGLGDCFDILIQGPTYKELIADGSLTPLRVFAPPLVNTEKLHTRAGEFIKGELIDAMDRPTITGSALDHYKKLTPGKQAVAFCVSVEHAKHVAQDFTAAGIRAESVDGSLERDLRAATIRAYARGDIKIITSCDLISEGFDCPRIEVGISLRPTQSLGLWRQQTGRILRPSEGKREAYLLDAAGNTIRHGLPTDDVTWSLAGAGGSSDGGKPAVSVRVCPKCFSAQESRLRICRNCKYEFPIESRTVAHKKGHLEELTPEALAARRFAQEQGMAGNVGTYEERVKALAQLGLMRNPKMRNPEGWARHVLEGRETKKRRKENT